MIVTCFGIVVVEENSLRVKTTDWESVVLHLYCPEYLSKFIQYYWVGFHMIENIN